MKLIPEISAAPQVLSRKESPIIVDYHPAFDEVARKVVHRLVYVNTPQKNVHAFTVYPIIKVHLQYKNKLRGRPRQGTDEQRAYVCGLCYLRSQFNPHNPIQSPRCFDLQFEQNLWIVAFLCKIAYNKICIQYVINVSEEQDVEHCD